MSGFRFTDLRYDIDSAYPSWQCVKTCTLKLTSYPRIRSLYRPSKIFHLSFPCRALSLRQFLVDRLFINEVVGHPMLQHQHRTFSKNGNVQSRFYFTFALAHKCAVPCLSVYLFFSFSGWWHSPWHPRRLSVGMYSPTLKSYWHGSR